MNNKLTELVFIIDRSGSMSGLEKDTVGGFNSMIEKQKREEGEVLVTTVLFSNKEEEIHSRKELKDVQPLTEKDYFVFGCTALLDALGNTIVKMSALQERLPENEKPDKTLYVITTDGMENASTEFSYKSVKKLIDREKNKGNEFVFMGANIDAVAEAAKFGIDQEEAVNFNNDAQGIELNYVCLNEKINCFKKGMKNKDWRKDIDADYKKRNK